MEGNLQKISREEATKPGRKYRGKTVSRFDGGSGEHRMIKNKNMENLVFATKVEVSIEFSCRDEKKHSS